MGSQVQQLTGRGGPQVAARQAAALFALSGALALLAIATSPAQDRALLLGIATADLLIAAAALGAPWHRWGRAGTAWLALAGFGVLGVSTYGFGGFAAGTGPFFVLLFVWLGIHHTPRLIVAMAVPAGAAYALGLYAAGAPGQLIGSTFVLVPVAVAVGLVIARRIRALEAANARAENAERWRAALTSSLAHDLRSPLTTIALALEMAGSDDEVPERLRPVLASATRQTDAIDRLAVSLLDLHRVEAGRLRLDLEDVALPELLKRVADLVGTGPVGTGSVGIDVAPEATVHADPERLQQVLVNLTGNALRHGRPPVTVTATCDGDITRIVVRDHGAGVPASARDRLFQPLETSLTDGSGTGLGLWTARLLTEAHGGTISYRPWAGGAEFCVELPGVR
jgi:signal transduction histidine kinase